MENDLFTTKAEMLLSSLCYDVMLHVSMEESHLENLKTMPFPSDVIKGTDTMQIESNAFPL